MDHEKFENILNIERLRYNKELKRLQVRLHVIFNTCRTHCNHIDSTNGIRKEKCNYYEVKGIGCNMTNCPYLPKK